MWPTLRLEAVRRAFRQDRLTLMRGAEISVDAGVPFLGTLLNALLLQVLEQRGAKVALDAAERFHREVGSSPLIEARHLHSLLGADFESVVRDHVVRHKAAAPHAAARSDFT
ncbi:MAG TPA: hypothetical protein VN605_11685 [Thermoanaerobaculia bacterium]|nr:hypothetical protein [Thermoanaerobaculia bacterium]